MAATLYSLSMSHPGHAARLMLELKGVPHRVVNFPAGTHALALRALGFPKETVPALRLDGRRLQGSTLISKELDSLYPEPALLPSAAVRDAEVWAERVLQPMPRRLFRWGLRHSAEFRRWFAPAAGLPFASLAVRTLGVSSVPYALRTGATNEVVRSDLAEIGARLDRVDSLLAEGVIGGERLNAADLQIGTTVRALMAFSDLERHFAGRAAAEHAMRVLPDFTGPAPAYLPAAWLVSGAAES